MHFLIGDLQGCCDAFERLLADIGFSPSRDQLYVLGDLVNRGPQSLQTLERLIGLGDAARCLLGNHDLHLLAVATACGRSTAATRSSRSSPPRAARRWLDWLRARPLAMQAQGWLMVHAGLVPQWDAALALRLAGELEADAGAARASATSCARCTATSPRAGRPICAGADRLRFAINVLTRIRFVQADGRLDLKTKEARDAPARGALPVVRRAGPAQPRHAHRLRPLVHARADDARGPAVARHRLRVGRRADRGAHRRRPARAAPGPLRAGAPAGLTRARVRR